MSSHGQFPGGGEGQGALDFVFRMRAGDYRAAGDAATQIRRVLHQAGFPPELGRRVAVVVFEAGLNIAIHALRGEVRVRVQPRLVEVEAQDEGPGIADLELAMQEGYSTAPPEVREMGYGTGMGLPNMARCADRLAVSSVLGCGTTVRAEFYCGAGAGQR